MENQYSGKHRFDVGDVVRVTSECSSADAGLEFEITGKRFSGINPCYEYAEIGGSDARDEHCWWDGFLELVMPSTLENV